PGICPQSEIEKICRPKLNARLDLRFDSSSCVCQWHAGCFHSFPAGFGCESQTPVCHEPVLLTPNPPASAWGLVDRESQPNPVPSRLSVSPPTTNHTKMSLAAPR